MKNIVITSISTIMTFIPWTIIPLRSNAWALEYPAAGIIISIYAAFMIISGIFTIFAYVKGKVQNDLMKVCMVINGIYAVGGVAAFCMMIV